MDKLVTGNTIFVGCVALLVWGLVAYRVVRRRRPSFITKMGIKVFSADDKICHDGIDAAVASIVVTFDSIGMWRLEDMLQHVVGMELVLVPDTSYMDKWDRRVAGHVENLRVHVAWGAPPHETALAHELIHYFDIKLNGQTDHTHASWVHKNYGAIAEANRRLAAVQS